MLARMQPTIAHISIHALREEGDVLTSIKDNHPRIFLSTPSARRATAECHAWKADLQISIHALREEGDLAEGVDRNREPKKPTKTGKVALLAEGVDRNTAGNRSAKQPAGRPPRGGRG